MGKVAAAVKPRHPEEMHLPPREKVVQVLQHLTEEDARRFLDRLLEGIEEAKVNGDLSCITNVVESWYRTLLFKMQPGHQKRREQLEAAVKKRPRGMDLEEVKQRLGLD